MKKKVLYLLVVGLYLGVPMFWAARLWSQSVGNPAPYFLLALTYVAFMFCSWAHVSDARERGHGMLRAAVEFMFIMAAVVAFLGGVLGGIFASFRLMGMLDPATATKVCQIGLAIGLTGMFGMLLRRPCHCR